MIVSESSTQTLATFTIGNGFYQLFPDQGTYTTSTTANLPNHFVVNPNKYVPTFTGTATVETGDFCVEPLVL